MHGVDLTAIGTVEDLYALIEDAQKEIARREAAERDHALGELEVLAQKYGKSVEEFLNLSRSGPTAKKSPARSTATRKKKTLEEATADLRAAGRSGGDDNADGSPVTAPE